METEQLCSNCGTLVTFAAGWSYWVHAAEVNGLIERRARRCDLFANPTTPIYGVDYH